ncbi:MAG: histidinol dehydrogenase [Chloroflexi bacterium]|nr:histidinol dehydrogenase [Chloroflexota bacterium]MCL5025385.1 histidinol dehydrogenase [Chloroflexota bacterium]
MTVRILSADEARRTVLVRRPLEERALPPAVAAGIRRAFGADIPPEEVVRRIIAQVRAEGDAALRDLGRRIDGLALGELEVPAAEVRAAPRGIPRGLRAALETAADRVRAFHAQGKPLSWLDASGTLGQLVRPLERVGLYAPGGRAVYPSTVLMTAIPARSAGVSEVVLCSPPGPNGRVHPNVLAAAAIAGVDRVFCLGGAGAIAAMAYGTESVPKVDKILGPGNIFVTIAKRQVFGTVGIDQLAGPTETMLIADGAANPAWVAADMLAQAEHDPLASAILITTSADMAEWVRVDLERQERELPTGSAAAEALAANGAIVVAADLDEAMELANAYAPEHLCLLVTEPWTLIGKVRNAGGVFLGEHSPEVLGDYVAGPSHVMPTGGSARFASPITILDFLKVTSLVGLGRSEAAALAPAAAAIADAEGLPAHAEAARQRAASQKL